MEYRNGMAVGCWGNGEGHNDTSRILCLPKMASPEPIVALATQYGRYGYRRIAALLRGAGWPVGKDRVQRVWRREGLKVPQKQRPRGRLWLNDGSCVRLRPERPNHVWSYDFVSARTHEGRTLRLLTLLDECPREGTVKLSSLAAFSPPAATAKSLILSL